MSMSMNSCVNFSSQGWFQAVIGFGKNQQQQQKKKEKKARIDRRPLNFSFPACNMTSEPQQDRRHTGLVLGPAPPDSDWWDRKLLSGAVVVPNFAGDKQGYRMYYYGRSSNLWAKEVEPFNPTLPTGRVGMAVSEDGLQFHRYQGHLDGGAIMDPSADYDAFDAVHLGVSDILYDSSSRVWRMYYFGGGYDEAKMPGSISEKKFRKMLGEGDAIGGSLANAICHKGLRLRPGTATSSDGLSFEDREGPILELGAEGTWDQNGVSWPRVLPPQGDGEEKVKRWLMTYHTRETGGPNNSGFFSAGVATSVDGKEWQKGGKILSVGEPGSWDEGGVSVRHMLPVTGRGGGGGGYIMVYEGCNSKFEFGIGLATSDDGLKWKKDTEAGPEPGGPILKARVGENVWDNIIVGSPYALTMNDGSFRMYYLGVGKLEGDETSKQGIGLAVSDGENYRSWRRFSE